MAQFGINLTTKHAHLLDCYFYDWNEKEMPDWMVEMGKGVLTPLINATNNRCLPFDNFINTEDVCLFLID